MISFEENGEPFVTEYNMEEPGMVVKSTAHKTTGRQQHSCEQRDMKAAR